MNSFFSRQLFSFLCVCFLFTFLQVNAVKYNILVGSPIRQKPAILREFLESLEGLDQNSYNLSYFFIDDNPDENSQILLQEFSKRHQNCCQILHPYQNPHEFYDCNESTHHWNESLIWKVAQFKDTMIEEARRKNYDYLFLIDSDIVLHPKTIDQLILAGQNVVSNIFWTNWRPESPLLPQVWMKDLYTQYDLEPGESLSPEESQQRFLNFLLKMRIPGTYEVGGLGACTLISNHALNQDISFKKIKNITFWGEDRHFCIRAVALGLDLYVDTHYPAFHIYRESALSDVKNFKRSLIKTSKNKMPRVTLSLIMHNEANRYLRQVLEDAAHYITDAVIIDDASTDHSVAICEEVLKEIPHIIIHNQESQFKNEINLRKQQWEETIKTNPDWIAFLDADEIFEPSFHQEIKNYILSSEYDAFYFRLYDFWDQHHYREDEYWSAHQHYRIFLVRYRPDIPYAWDNQTPQHCGRFPSTINKFIGMVTPIRLKHFGWAKEEDRIAKYHRYKTLDPTSQYGIAEQYESILDPNPHLIPWIE